MLDVITSTTVDAEIDSIAERSGISRAVIEDRRESGAYRYDEVWEGEYVIMPLPNLQHQRFVGRLQRTFGESIEDAGLGESFPGLNVSDREGDWTKNYRCPDVAVFLADSTAKPFDTHAFGGPDFAVEITSPNDRTREKFDFYAKFNTRELLLIDRDPWALELYRLNDGQLQLVGKLTVESSEPLNSEIAPLSFRLQSGEERPHISVAHTDGEQFWVI